jgi:hypothetical protein
MTSRSPSLARLPARVPPARFRGPGGAGAFRRSPRSTSRFRACPHPVRTLDFPCAPAARSAGRPNGGQPVVVIGPIPGRAVLTRGGLSRPGTRSDAFPSGLWECLAPVSSAHAATGSAPCGTPRIPPGIQNSYQWNTAVPRECWFGWRRGWLRATLVGQEAPERKVRMKPARHQFTVLQQICDLIPGHLVSKLAREHGVEEQSRTFSP